MARNFSLTAYVAQFIVSAKPRSIPADVMHLGKRSILDGIGLALCMAILLIERKAGLAEFTDEVVNRRDVRRMIERIKFSVHPLAEAAGYEK